MGFVRGILKVGTLAWILSGCSQPHIDFSVSVDLNGDNIQEVIEGYYRREGCCDSEYNLTVQFAGPDGEYKDPKVIMRLEERPEDIMFIDPDTDHDMDLVFSKYGKMKWNYGGHEKYLTTYDTYILRNDGNGNFGEPELVSRKMR